MEMFIKIWLRGDSFGVRAKRILIGPFSSSGLVLFYLRGKSADLSRRILSLELIGRMLGVCAV